MVNLNILCRRLFFFLFTTNPLFKYMHKLDGYLLTIVFEKIYIIGYTSKINPLLVY
jgi:hypothetical protein